ncbi:MAG TPA: hypothetical protein VF476_16675 [Chitinophagaceae bacterium]
MKQFFFCSLAFLFSFHSNAQTKPDNLKNYLQVSAGRSSNGTGDLRGIIFSTQYGKHFKKKLLWNVFFSGTIHDGSYPLKFTVGTREVDGSIRYTTGGLQLGGGIGYSILKKSSHEILAKANCLFRYQSSSYPDYYQIDYPAGTGLPYPVILYSHSTPQRTYTVGGEAQLQYNYVIKEKWSIGIIGGVQTDTDGNTITQISLAGGIKF